MLVETSRSVQIGVRRETIASSAIRMQRGDSERPTFGNRGRRATVANPGFVGSSPTEPQAATGLQFRLVFRRACVGSPQKRGPSVRAIIFPTKGVAVDRDYSGRIV